VLATARELRPADAEVAYRAVSSDGAAGAGTLLAELL
jgi:hypothetical protein